MKIVTCNFQGRKHSERNEPCEDSVFYLQGSDVTTVAVADGAGSKKYEHAKDGADAVTKAICNFFEAKFDDFFESSNELELRSVVQTICHKALKERAAELELDSIETMASTLLAVSIKGNKLISVQIGDGLLGRLFHNELETITMPQNGEYASSTYFINNADAYKMVQIRKMFLSGTSHLFLMSDGVADCMFNDFNGKFNESLKSLLETADEPNGEKKVGEAIKKFIVDEDPMSDDCTVAIVCFNERKCPVETETLQPPKPTADPVAPVAPAVAPAVPVAAPVAPAVAPVVATDSVNVPPVNNVADAPVLSPQYVEQQPKTVSLSSAVAQEAVENEALEEKKPLNWKLISIIAGGVLAVILAVVLVIVFVGGSDKDDKKKSNDREKISVSSVIETSSTTPAIYPGITTESSSGPTVPSNPKEETSTESQTDATTTTTTTTPTPTPTTTTTPATKWWQ